MYQLFSKQNISSRFQSEEEVLDFARSVARGRRLEMPKKFSKPLIELIDIMWADDPRVRPTAAKALIALDTMQGQMIDGGGSAGSGLFKGCFCLRLAVAAS